MTREEAYTLLEVMAINIVGELATVENPVLAKQLEAIDMAQKALSADVVRCKDCQYRKKVGTSYYCDLDEFNVQDADFCSWGERKEP